MFTARPFDQGFAATEKTTFPLDMGGELTKDIEGFGDRNLAVLPD